jgi:hypothetical protein
MSCLFDSMFTLLQVHGIYFKSSHILRLKITKFMRDNPKYSLESGTIEDWIKMVSGDMGTNYRAYIDGMKLASTWGGAMEMAVMSKIFSIIIHVTGRGKKEPLAVFDCTVGKADKIFVLHWTGSHYTPVRLDECPKMN